MIKKLFAVVVFAVGAAACSGKGGAPLLVSAGVNRAAVSDAAATSLDAGNGLSVDRIRILVRKVEVEGGVCASSSGVPAPSGALSSSSSSSGDGSGGSGSDSGESDDSGSDGSSSDDEGECEVEGGPFLVDLSGGDLTSGVHWVAALTVPAGTYEEVAFVINTISAGKANGDAGLQAMVDAHASILVDGMDGESPFTFSTPIEVQQEREGEIVVDPATGANLTLDIDPSGWFKAADGSKLSPADPTALGEILANIRASIRLLHDEDHDGEDDASEHGGPG